MMQLFVLASVAFSQSLTLPAPSPAASVSQAVGVVEVKVVYSSPAVKGRTVWGDLVPYDAMWRTGANAATRFETTGELTIGGSKVPAGAYALFTIPGKDSWTVILNKDVTQPGTGDTYDKALDVARLTVKAAEAPARERMTFLFSDTDEDSTRLDLEWAGLRVSVPIETDTKAAVDAQIAAYTKGSGGALARAGRYKAEAGDLAGALPLLDASRAIEVTWFNTWLKADVLHQQEKHKEAYALATQAMELGKEAGDGFFYKERVEKALAEWKKK